MAWDLQLQRVPRGARRVLGAELEVAVPVRLAGHDLRVAAIMSSMSAIASDGCGAALTTSGCPAWRASVASRSSSRRLGTFSRAQAISNSACLGLGLGLGIRLSAPRPSR